MYDKKALSYASPLPPSSLGPFPSAMVLRAYFFGSIILREADRVQLNKPEYRGISTDGLPKESVTNYSARFLARLLTLELTPTLTVPIPKSSRNKKGAFPFATSHSAISRLYISLGPEVSSTIEGRRFRAAFATGHNELTSYLLERYGNQPSQMSNFVRMEADLAVMAGAVGLFLLNLGSVNKLHAFLDDAPLLLANLSNRKIESYALLGEAPTGLTVAAIAMFGSSKPGASLAADLKKDNWDSSFDHLWRFLPSARATHPYFIAFLERTQNSESKGNTIKVPKAKSTRIIAPPSVAQTEEIIQAGQGSVAQEALPTEAPKNVTPTPITKLPTPPLVLTEPLEGVTLPVKTQQDQAPAPISSDSINEPAKAKPSPFAIFNRKP